jgi:aminomethyltransferase
MPRLSPFHARTSALCTSFLWKEWSGYAAVCRFDGHSEREYYAIRHTAGLLDATPLNKYDVRGPEAGAMLARVWTRDISKIRVGQVVYSALCDEHGKCLDDGTIARLAPDHFRATSTERWLRWFQRHARGYDVTVEDTTDRIACLALQGPHARDILKPLVEWDMDIMRFFRVRKTRLDGIEVWVSRTGYTGDLGYEIWVENDHALKLWDTLMEAGRPWGMEPFGLDALDVARVEAGFVLQAVDYISAKNCLIESRKSSPMEAGLGWTVNLDRDPFVGQRALLEEKERGSRWALVGVEIDWAALEKLYETYGLPPHLAPEGSRDAIPIYDLDGSRQIGQVTSTAWSPTLKKYLGLGQVFRAYGQVGQRLLVEHTVEFHRDRLPARVVEKPFFDPPRKKFTPKKPKKKPSPGGST